MTKRSRYWHPVRWRVCLVLAPHNIREEIEGLVRALEKLA